MDRATRNLKATVKGNPDLQNHFSHPEHPDLSFLYSVIAVDDEVGVPIAGSTRAETGVCFFADQQIDRSPTGSAVAARIAVAYAKDRSSRHDTVTYHSMVSKAAKGRGGFVGKIAEEVGERDGFPVVRVQVEGYASYIGASSFVAEDNDSLGDDGFLFERLC